MALTLCMLYRYFGLVSHFVTGCVGELCCVEGGGGEIVDGWAKVVESRTIL